MAEAGKEHDPERDEEVSEPDTTSALEVAPEILPPAAPEEGGEDIAPPVRRRDAVGRFIAEAQRYPRLSEDEERRLADEVKRGSKAAARKLVVHNLRLVVSIAYQYRRAWTNILDLFQEGSLGLVEAVRRWEPTLGARFGSYAAYWIRAYVLRFLLTNARLIHLGNTRAGRKLFFRLEQERQKLLALGLEATPKLLAARLDVDEKDIEEVSRHMAAREVSLSPRPDEEEGIGLEERIDSGTASPEAAAARSELADAVGALSRRFAAGLDDERDRAVWKEYLAAEEPRPLTELGARFGVSKQRMGQIADRLKKRFRALVEAELGADVQAAWAPADEAGG